VVVVYDHALHPCVCAFSVSALLVSIGYFSFQLADYISFMCFYSLFQFSVVVLCSNINERMYNACSLYEFVLFDESKG